MNDTEKEDLLDCLKSIGETLKNLNTTDALQRGQIKDLQERVKQLEENQPAYIRNQN